MAKKKGTFGKIATFTMWLVGLIVTLGLGGLFWTGGALSYPLLSYLPLWAHQIVGGILIGSGVLGVIFKVIGWFK